MARTVISLSASDGAAGERVAPLVADSLGFRIVDEEVIARAAEEAGVDQSAVADAEKRPSLAARVLGDLPAVGVAVGMSGLAGLPALTADDLRPSRDRFRDLIRSTIRDIASGGGVVIVAHAASLALRDRTDSLRVFITASIETRRARFAEAQGLNEREVERLIARGDANRASYLDRFYGVSEEEPSLYDMVLNSDRLTPEDLADVIVRASQR